MKANTLQRTTSLAIFLFFSVLTLSAINFENNLSQVIVAISISLMLITISLVIIQVLISRSVVFPSNSLVLLMYLMIAYSFFTSLFALEPKQSFTSTILVLISYLFVLAIYINFNKDFEMKKLKIILNILCFQVVGLVILQLYLNYFGPIAFGGKIFVGEHRDMGQYSITSLLDNPNVFAMFLSVGILGNLISVSIKKKLSFLNIFMIIVFFVALIMTNSRTGIFSVCIVLMLHIIFRIKINTKKVILYFSLFTLIVLTVLVGINLDLFNLQQYNFMFIEKAEYGLRGRDERWLNALHIIADKPLTGIGNVSNLDPSLVKLFETHNGYLNLAIRGGILFLGLFLLIIVIIYAKTIKIIKTIKGSREAHIVMTILLAISGILLQEFFEHRIAFSFINNFMASFFWLLVIYAFIITNNSSKHKGNG